MGTQVPHEGLTSVEQSLVEYVRRGEPRDLAADDETWPTLIRMGCGFGEPRSLAGLIWRTSPQVSASS